MNKKKWLAPIGIVFCLVLSFILLWNLYPYLAYEKINVEAEISGNLQMTIVAPVKYDFFNIELSYTLESPEPYSFSNTYHALHKKLGENWYSVPNQKRVEDCYEERLALMEERTISLSEEFGYLDHGHYRLIYGHNEAIAEFDIE